MIKPNNDGRVGGGTTNIGGGSSSEQDHGTKTWPDGDGKLQQFKVIGAVNIKIGSIEQLSQPNFCEQSKEGWEGF